ncbi:hypothetical protein [Clostridium felsineum]|uniref:hypothetical protein n=1 Tax=Clostridium felsineum TaxID=36839 RepID=UPI00098C2E09|nr:hypothetical protein [Clostridium felsineum]URZ17195.1 hypothetical protein CLFE_032470 [Clostridium felsineum DSM 794]
MIKTEFGNFDGDSWEELCQVCFELKYGNEGYQEMVAHSNGDLGIEGFTRAGKVFQCYCPDIEYSADDLYENQRDKINKDLNKLIKYKDELEKYLVDVKIKTWHFVTPYFHKKDIVKYCANKAKKMRELNLSILDENFDVLIHNVNFIARELPDALNMKKIKINVNLAEEINSNDIEQFKQSDVCGINNLVRKSAMIITRERIRNKYIERQLNNYLKGKKQMDLLDSHYKFIYEKIINILSSFEDEVEDICIYESEEKGGREILDVIEKKFEQRLILEIGENIDRGLIDSIKRYAISDWLIRCPFEIDVEECR